MPLSQIARWIAVAALSAGPALAADNPLQPSPAWDEMRLAVIGTETEPPVDPAVLDLDAPMRADNPALVPIRITQPPGAPAITRLALVIDENPAPVAAEFTLGPATAPLDLEVRVRVNAYSDVRAIATLADGRQVMAGRFVKASGGCAAPAGRSGEDARKDIGAMRWTSEPAGDRAMGQLMIRHPNFSGLQRDQLTLLDIPAEFVRSVTVRQGDALLMEMEGGISISENPVFRLGYTPDGAPVTVHAEDTEDRQFDASFPGSGG